MQIEFCANECHKQQSGELSVFWMCRAYETARIFGNDGAWHPPFHRFAIMVGERVEPLKNVHGYRRSAVMIGHQLIGWENITRQMEKLSDAVEQRTLDPLEAYEEFERIHPFIDGNGRTGAILFNYMLGTLERPQVPPDLFAAKVREEMGRD